MSSLKHGYLKKQKNWEMFHLDYQVIHVAYIYMVYIQ